MGKLHKLLGVAGALMVALPIWPQQSVLPSGATRIPTLQDAIYSAAPGSVLNADTYGPRLKRFIRVDRPITLVGGTYHEILFDGPGYGRVFLRNAQILQDPDNSGSPPAHPGITAGGFDLLGIANSIVWASGAASHVSAQGASALVAGNVSTLLLIESSFYATIGGWHGEYTCEAWASGSAGVSASGAFVFALNSTIQGGGGIRFGWDDSVDGPCPGGPVNNPPAAGAPGLIAKSLRHSGCTFLGGPGAYWFNYPGEGSQGPPVQVGWSKEIEIVAGGQFKPR